MSLYNPESVSIFFSFSSVSQSLSEVNHFILNVSLYNPQSVSISFSFSVNQSFKPASYRAQSVSYFLFLFLCKSKPFNHFF